MKLAVKVQTTAFPIPLIDLGNISVSMILVTVSWLQEKNPTRNLTKYSTYRFSIQYRPIVHRINTSEITMNRFLPSFSEINPATRAPNKLPSENSILTSPLAALISCLSRPWTSRSKTSPRGLNTTKLKPIIMPTSDSTIILMRFLINWLFLMAGCTSISELSF